MPHRLAKAALSFSDQERAFPAYDRLEPQAATRPIGLPARELSEDMQCVTRTMLCYRYRTAALIGPWRAQARDAIDDAVLAHQAELDQKQPEGYRWLVQGDVEESFGRHPTRPARSGQMHGHFENDR
jgi:hypothetical protein